MVFQTFNFIQARGLNHLQVYGLLMIQAIIYSKLKDVRLRNNDRFFPQSYQTKCTYSHNTLFYMILIFLPQAVYHVW